MDLIGTIPVVIEWALDSSTDESSDEDLVILQCYREQEPRSRTQNFVEATVFMMTDNTFKSHFRVTRETFQFLMQTLGASLRRQSQRYGRYPITEEKQLLLALWSMATPDSYRSLCDRFDVGRATAWRTVWKVVKVLYRLLPIIIEWPTLERAKKTWEHVYHKHRFPKVLGAIDGTHIRIAAPNSNPETYINRKGYHSIQLQVVCDEKLRFIHVYCGEVGSVHDARVFRLSGLQNYCTDEYFPENSHLLGDAAYGIQKHLMVPYKNNGHLEADEIMYNAVHSSSRIMIERAIGLFKGRFRSLLDKLPFTRTDLIPRYVIACCILHNICIMRNDFIDIPILINDEVSTGQSEEINDITKDAGIAKRNVLKYIISNP